MPAQGDWLEFLFVLVTVVSAEKKISGSKTNTDVRLSTACVATVFGGEVRWGWLYGYGCFFHGYMEPHANDITA